MKPLRALAVIDMQRWMFRLPERASQLGAAVPKINRLAQVFAAAGLPVFDLRVFHKADRSTWSRRMLKHDYSCMIEGTADVALVDGLVLPMSATLVAKTANSAFFGTDFERLLRAKNIETLTLAGAFMDGCVGLTAADAAQRGFDVVIAEDAVAHCNPRHRAVITEWLVDMYELTVADTGSLLGALAP